jgi:hypothetical protein
VYRSLLALGAGTVDSTVYYNGFDLGSVTTINSITYASTGAGTVDLKVRLAPSNGIFSAWMTTAAAAGQTAQFVEYRAKLSGGGTDLSLDQVSVDCGLSTPTPTPSPSATPTHTPSLLKAPDPGTNFIFPSPVSDGHATLAYAMVSAGSMRMEIWNEKGELAAVVEDNKPSGVQYTPFSVDGFAAGVYFYQVTLTYQSGVREVLPPKKFAVQR